MSAQDVNFQSSQTFALSHPAALSGLMAGNQSPPVQYQRWYFCAEKKKRNHFNCGSIAELLEMSWTRFEGCFVLFSILENVWGSMKSTKRKAGVTPTWSHYLYPCHQTLHVHDSDISFVWWSFCHVSINAGCITVKFCNSWSQDDEPAWLWWSVDLTVPPALPTWRHVWFLSEIYLNEYQKGHTVTHP